MRRATRLLPVLCVCVALGQPAEAQGADPAWPRRVLITNDNGLDDPKIVALARAFAPQAETWVVAPLVDRSGSTRFLSVSRSGRLAAERRELGAGIRAFAVDGFPADCVLLALYGPMRDARPDLVVSGINGGPNLAHDCWGPVRSEPPGWPHTRAYRRSPYRAWTTTFREPWLRRRAGSWSSAARAPRAS
jgi:hypothetical protein